jgi:hypothetical protein
LPDEDEDLLDEAEVEHASTKELIAQIEAEGQDGDLFEAKVKVLGEYVRHHVEEEEGGPRPVRRGPLMADGIRPGNNRQRTRQRPR